LKMFTLDCDAFMILAAPLEIAVPTVLYRTQTILML